MIHTLLPLALALLASPVLQEHTPPPDLPRGLLSNDPGACDGLTLIAPLDSTKVHLLDMDGEVVHTWETGAAPGGAVEWMPNGHLLHSSRENDTPVFHGGGIGGHLRELDWDGNVVWHYELHGADRQAHHDFELLPNGNVLLIAWEFHTADEAAAHGRDPDAIGDEGLWSDVVIEIEPTRPVGGRVVWEWRSWDHLVQDRDASKSGYGSIPALPGRIDINGDHRDRPAMTDDERERIEKLEAEMEALGYTGGAKPKRLTPEDRKREAERKRDPDWLHTNAVAYHPAYDLIVLSTPRLNELWVIDHSTTTEEARGSTGGRYGAGGDLLWRWGNPRVHGAGSDDDKRLFFQHDPRWVLESDGAPAGELRLTVFNNGGGRKGGDYSSVEELLLPFDPETGFRPEPGKPFGPTAPAWSFVDRPDFYSGFISGATRLPNGNTLICEGAEGRVFEVTSDRKVVWDYRNPHGGDVTDPGKGGRAPSKALFRAQRIPRGDPSLPSELAPKAEDETAGEPRGLRVREPGAVDGYTLFGPLSSAQVHLVDMDGKIVHTWETGRAPGEAHYLLPNGHLLRSSREDDNPVFHGGGIGGHVQEFDWDGNVVWHYELHGAQKTQHHDLEPLANGNVLMIAWEHRSRDEALAHGRDDDAVGDDGMWVCHVLEVEPTPPSGGNVVWEWHAWDHLVQDRDPAKPDYAAVPDRAGRIDINGDHRDQPPMTDAERERIEALEAEMEALGYTGGAPKKKLTKEERKDRAERKRRPDWLHINSVKLHPELELLALSSPKMNEVWVIDRSTTTAEAKGSAGGRYGKGGDLLWRWGNPRNYGAGTDDDRRFYYQHDPEWLFDAPAGELRLLVFNNGRGRKGGDFSTIEEFILPFDPARGFTREPGKPYGPSEPVWTYADRDRFFSGFISGAQRLSNGNTLICEGDDGRFFEVTRDGEIVWEYANPLGGDVKEKGKGGGAPKHAVFRATRIPLDHPGLSGRL